MNATGRPLAVPALVRQRAMADGAAGQRWLDELAAVVAGLADRWGLEVGQALDGGTASYVTAATDAAGRACVLKITMPLAIDERGDGFARTVAVHQLAAGRGCAGLLAHDDTVGALLLERLGPNLDQLRMPLPQLLDTIAETLLAFWRPVPAGCPLPTGADQAAWLARYIVETWEALDRPCPQAVVDRAVGFCEERAAAFDVSRAVLVHGDAHGWNTLAAPGGGYKFVDPEGLLAEPAHDLAVPMREYNLPLLAGDAGDTPRLVRQRAETLATHCGVDPEPVWQWGFVERVSTGLANLREFDGDDGLAFLEVAARCL